MAIEHPFGVEFAFDDRMGLGQVALARRDFKEAEKWFGQAIDQTKKSARTAARGHRLLFFRPQRPPFYPCPGLLGKDQGVDGPG